MQCAEIIYAKQRIHLIRSCYLYCEELKKVKYELVETLRTRAFLMDQIYLANYIYIVNSALSNLIRKPTYIIIFHM